MLWSTVATVGEVPRLLYKHQQNITKADTSRNVLTHKMQILIGIQELLELKVLMRLFLKL